MHPCIKLLAAAAALLAISSVWAEDKDLGNVVVTATRQAQRSNELLADVSLISRAEIEQAGQSTLIELLTQQAGIQSYSQGGPGKVTGLFIRGSGANQSVILIDGVRIGSATSGTPSLEQIPLSQIDHIEILRGPASALYGADAIGGVIQIFTRRGQGPAAVDAFVGFGSHNTRDLSAGLSGGNDAWSYSLRGSHDTTDGIKAINDKTKQPYSYDPNSSADGFRNSGMSGSLVFRPAAGHELGATVLRTEGRNWYEGGPSFDTHADVSQSVLGVYSRNQFSAPWTSTIRLNQSVDDSTSYAWYSPTGAKFKTIQEQVVWQNDIRLTPGNLLVALESLNQKAHGDTNFDKSRRIDSILVGWSGHYGDHRLQANVRRDDNSQFGAKTTGHVGYGYLFTPNLRIQGSLATAFRPPTFNDLYYPGYSNLDLQPETARNKEIGLIWEQGTTRAGITMYDNYVNNLIALDASYVPQNIGKARLQGTTLSYATVVSGFNISGNLDFLDARDALTDKRLPRRAREQANLRVKHSLGAWTLGGEWQLVGDRYDDTMETTHMGGYSVLNALARYAVNSEWSIEARANNLANKKYETSWGYGNLGANAFIGVRYTPK